MFRPSRRGITPAHAGKSQKDIDRFAKVKDHPRTRGEKLDMWRCDTLCAGSPPHTRGKVTNQRTRGGRWRITPAHAGKSPALLVHCFREEDHPRTRGEKRHRRFLRVTGAGSPPHTRGKALQEFLSACRSGITPAHAGKRFGSLYHPDALEDHPRTRGEKLICKSVP